MKQSSVFVRGQVWYWNDPIYGEKKANIDVKDGESTLRYSRYVIIAQTTETIKNTKSILVIPCSSKKKEPTDVELRLAHLTCFSSSFARCDMIFPINAKYLDHYICTLSEDAMKEIDRFISKLLLRNIDDEDQETSFESNDSDDTVEDETEEVPEEETEEVLVYSTEETEEVVEEIPQQVIEEIQEVCITEEEVEEELVYKSIDIDLDKIVFETIRPSISKFSKMISKYMRYEKVYNVISPKHKKATAISTFYDTLDEAIFKSLINLLDIKTDGKEIKYPEVDVTDSLYNTWLFFSRIYNDRRISHERNDPVLIMCEYKKIYGDDTISHDWVEFLEDQLISRLRCNHNQIQYLMSIITSNFCNKLQ